MSIDPAEQRARLLATLRLQYPDTLADGGFRLLDPATGEQYTDHRRHLVATCRATANFAIGVRVDGPRWCADAAAHGLRVLREAHRADGGGYHLVIDEVGEPIDRTRSAYGHAFALLAAARATSADLDGARSELEHAVDILDERFHEPDGPLRSDHDGDWTEREAYRGQNANMHACEAYVAAYEATGESRFLRRARSIAERITVDLAAETDGLLWEHYTADWTHDFEYNADEPRHQFRPPGYQPGHHAEWAKLLALLDRYSDGEFGAASSSAPHVAAPSDGWAQRAAELFDAAIDLGWLGDGFAYTVDRDGDVLVSDRYGWAVAEAIGAAAALAERARARGEDSSAEEYLDWHARLVETADRFRGPAGLWYEGRRGEPGKDGGAGDPIQPDPPGVEPDYHPLGAWFEGWRSFNASEWPRR